MNKKKLVTKLNSVSTSKTFKCSSLNFFAGFLIQEHNSEQMRESGISASLESILIICLCRIPSDNPKAVEILYLEFLNVYAWTIKLFHIHIHCVQKDNCVV